MTGHVFQPFEAIEAVVSRHINDHGKQGDGAEDSGHLFEEGDFPGDDTVARNEVEVVVGELEARQRHSVHEEQQHDFAARPGHVETISNLSIMKYVCGLASTPAEHLQTLLFYSMTGIWRRSKCGRTPGLRPT